MDSTISAASVMTASLLPCCRQNSALWFHWRSSSNPTEKKKQRPLHQDQPAGHESMLESVEERSELIWTWETRHRVNRWLFQKGKCKNNLRWQHAASPRGRLPVFHTAALHFLTPQWSEPLQLPVDKQQDAASDEEAVALWVKLLMNDSVGTT